MSPKNEYDSSISPSTFAKNKDGKITIIKIPPTMYNCRIIEHDLRFETPSARISRRPRKLFIFSDTIVVKYAKYGIPKHM